MRDFIHQRVVDSDSQTGVYAITNTLNGMKYVGSAARTFKSRWALHLHDLRHGRHHSSHLQRAWNKYGEAFFAFSILAVCSPLNCVRVEQEWIDRLRSYDRKFGYNACSNAASPLGLKRSDATRAKLRISSKWSNERRAKQFKIAAAQYSRRPWRLKLWFQNQLGMQPHEIDWGNAA